MWRSDYEQSEGDRVSSASRANNLLALISIVTAATTLIVGSVVDTHPVPVAVALSIGSVLLVAAFATVVLAIRAQQVSQWDAPRIDPASASSKRALTLMCAIEFHSAARQNSYRLNNVFGYLRDAQRWALIAVTMLVLLAPTAVLAEMLKSSSRKETRRLIHRRQSPIRALSRQPLESCGSHEADAEAPPSLLEKRVG